MIAVDCTGRFEKANTSSPRPATSQKLNYPRPKSKRVAAVQSTVEQIASKLSLNTLIFFLGWSCGEMWPDNAHSIYPSSWIDDFITTASRDSVGRTLSKAKNSKQSSRCVRPSHCQILNLKKWTDTIGRFSDTSWKTHEEKYQLRIPLHLSDLNNSANFRHEFWQFFTGFRE